MPRQESSQEQQRMYQDDELILNYHDAVIYGRDLTLLEEPEPQEQQQESSSYQPKTMKKKSSSHYGWLNDSIIHFHMMRLTHHDQPPPPPQDGTNVSSSSSSSSSADVVMCLDPSVLSFLMHQIDLEQDHEELQEFLSSHDYFQTIQQFFLPINDNLNSSHWQTPGAAGTHWSLLVAYVVNVNVNDDGDQQRRLEFYHFDSVTGHNHHTAVAVATLWNHVWTLAKATVQRRGNESSPPNTTTTTTTTTHCPATTTTTRVRVQECRTPQQTNGYDCGLHVLGAVEALLMMKNIPTTSTSPPNDDDASSSVQEQWEMALEQYFDKHNPSRTCDALRQRMAQDIRSLASSTTTTTTTVT